MPMAIHHKQRCQSVGRRTHEPHCLCLSLFLVKTTTPVDDARVGDNREPITARRLNLRKSTDNQQTLNSTNNERSL